MFFLNVSIFIHFLEVKTAFLFPTKGFVLRFSGVTALQQNCKYLFILQLKKIPAYAVTNYTLECGFLHHTIGNIQKAQSQYNICIALVLFFYLKEFCKFFAFRATNRNRQTSVSAKRDKEFLSPFNLARQGVRT